MKNVSVQTGLGDSTVMYTVARLDLALRRFLLFGVDAAGATQNDKDEDDAVDDVRDDDTSDMFDTIEVAAAF